MTNTDLFPIGLDRLQSQLHRFNEIPTFHITAKIEDVNNIHEKYTDDIKVPCNLTYITSDGLKLFSNASLSIGGRSSRHFTKLPYNIALNHGDRLEGYRKFKLRSCASDPSYMRERLAYDMLYATHRPASRASHVRIYINDKAIGLFLLTEKYDDRWLRNEYNHGEIYDSGNLYRAKGALPKSNIFADLSYHPENTSFYDIYTVEGQAKHENSTLDALVSFTKFINDQLQWQLQNPNELDTSVDVWETQMNVKGFLTNMALEFMLGSWDGYLENTQNFYLYKEPTTQMMDWIGWDYDYVLGSGTVKMERMLIGNYSDFSGMLTRPLTKALLAIPTFQDLMDAQVDAINQAFFMPRSVFPIIDAWAEFLKHDIEWDQNLKPVRQGKSFSAMFGQGANGKGVDSLTTKHQTGMSFPLDFDMGTAADFLFRINSKLPLNLVMNGPTKHASLLGLKEYFLKKSDNVKHYYDTIPPQ
ncbi:coth-domain-containing protein [Hesseltinella vesiculosa]|uniref:Coth-domain-containing protein n=1 Tax=Hesseltinella vesiculosa TaxID=101127 RepID=A0A1X2G6N8_9FUNG|nr:coth-domain-containing protein [Hesseltinella vesiculosa]